MKKMKIVLITFTFIMMMFSCINVSTVTLKAADAVAKVNDTEYTTFDEAFKEATDGDTVVLLTDATTEGLNVTKNITIDGANHNLTFTKYGIALWGKDLIFNNVNMTMNGIASTPSNEWSWMSICTNNNASITLNNSMLTMDGGDLDRHAIYLTESSDLNLNSSVLTIKNYGQDALERDKGSGYEFNLKDSIYTADRTRGGIIATFDITVDNSQMYITNNKTNGSNGSHFDIKNGSNVVFDNNKDHGLSAGKLSIADSTVTSTRNGGNGIHVKEDFTITNSAVNVTENRCTIMSQWTIPGAIYIAKGGTVTNSELLINNNLGSGIYQKAGDLVFDTASHINITKNVANRLGYGGGIYIASGTAVIPEGVELYNNHASIAGDDIYSIGTVQFGLVGIDWYLDGEDTISGYEGHSHCTDLITGYYDDAEESRWEAHSEDTTLNHLVNYEQGTFTNVAIKAAHGIDLTTDDETDKSENTNTNDKKDEAVDTGDMSNYGLWLGLFAVSFVIAGSLVIKKSKR